ncbi:MAG: FtsB family cell division protein [Eubacteriaceae bacterium]|jgi:cell division protein DivIC
MSRGSGNRSFKSRFNSILVVAAILMIPAFVYIGNFIKIFTLQSEISSLKTQIETTRDESSQLDDDIAQIGSQSYIEKTARKYLGLYYPNEKIVIPVEAKKTDTQSSGTQTDTSAQSTTQSTDQGTDQSTTQSTDESTTDQSTADQSTDQSATDQGAADQSTTDQNTDQSAAQTGETQ